MQQIRSSCFLIGSTLTSQEEQNKIASEALQWWRAIAKEINEPSTHLYIKSEGLE
jgi:cob(I)alamin adenosyltransferase